VENYSCKSVDICEDKCDQALQQAGSHEHQGRVHDLSQRIYGGGAAELDRESGADRDNIPVREQEGSLGQSKFKGAIEDNKASQTKRCSGDNLVDRERVCRKEVGQRPEKQSICYQKTITCYGNQGLVGDLLNRGS